MDVLTDSGLTLIVKTSEPENANAVEDTGENTSLLPPKIYMNIISSGFFSNEKCT